MKDQNKIKVCDLLCFFVGVSNNIYGIGGKQYRSNTS